MQYIPSIPEFYAGRSVFITGATGFMGKVLVEKLLRSCEKINKIYLLVRHKKGVEPQQRIAELVECELFNELRRTQPDFREKIIGIEGDLLLENLGISDEDRKLVTKDVSIIFHSAATVRFDEPLEVAVEMNMVGVQRMLDLSRQLNRLDAFVHVSTAYSNCDRKQIKEEVYEMPMHPRKLIEGVSLPNAYLKEITQSLLENRPNTYTYTKAMAEVLVQDAAREGLPITIVRPSIVGASRSDPFPGWVDNLNGPSGMFLAVGRGALRMMYGTPDATADIIPVDMAISMMIAAGWYTAIQKPEEMPVFNCTTGRLNPLPWGKVAASAEKYMTLNPLNGVARLPKAVLTRSRIRRNVSKFFDNLLPVCALDMYLYAMGKKPVYYRLMKRMAKPLELLEFFTTNHWEFSVDNVVCLHNLMSEEDKKTFDFDARSINWDEYFEDFCLGAKKHLLKEDTENMVVARKKISRLQQRSQFINVAFGLGVWWVCHKRSEMMRTAATAIYTWCLTQAQRLPAIAAVPHN